MRYKKAKDWDEAFDIEEKYEDQPHGWIHWEGTDVCMEINCKCGCQFYINSSHAYHVKCPECGRVYSCNGHIELIELEEEPLQNVIKG